jgi:class 3 adenylate cyclase
VGSIGPENHQDSTVIGRHVNLAARLEQEAKPGQILISQRTHNLVKNEIEAEKIGKIEDMGEIAVKGFDSPVKVYNVVPYS